MSLVKVARAAQGYYCQEPYGPWAHATRIERGDLYVRITTPPGEGSEFTTDPFEIEAWWTTTMCVPCALGGADRTVIKVITALYERGVLAECPNAPKRLVLQAGYEHGLRAKAKADAAKSLAPVPIAQ